MRHRVEFLKMLNESTSFVINQRNHWRVECLLWNEVTHLIHLMSLYWNKWGLATEVNFVWAAAAINNTQAVQTPRFKLKFLSASALSKIIKAGYAALQLEYFFTAGPDEVRAWTVRVRASLPLCTYMWAWGCVPHTCTHTLTHKRIHTVSRVPPCWHPHWYHTLSTLSWLCFSQSLQAKDNFNYWWAAEQWKWGLHWLRRATIDFAHYVHENVSILCRSACPPPAAGDKEPVHCACLICVTEVVCAKIDVAFHSTVCGPCWGLLLPVCLSLLSPGHRELFAMGLQVLHQYRCWLCMLVLCRILVYFFLE